MPGEDRPPETPVGRSGSGRSGSAQRRRTADSSRSAESVREAASSTGRVRCEAARNTRRRGEFREFFLGLRRGFVLGRCRTCETFYLMAKLCVEEGGELLAPSERADATGWADGAALVDLDFGCEGACAVIPLYSRIAR